MCSSIMPTEDTHAVLEQNNYTQNTVNRNGNYIVQYCHLNIAVCNLVHTLHTTSCNAKFSNYSFTVTSKYNKFCS